jgi:hypothetical protein
VTELIEALFQQQVKTWPRLARGIEALAHAQTRAVRIDWFDVFIRHLPHRAASTTAAVDRDSIAKRPCFLCAENLDQEEKGLDFNADYVIYFNPFPILERHLSIVHRAHGKQHIAGETHTMLQLAAALPGYFVLYNGPECGASAPDHTHFQAALRTLFPIEKDTAGIDGIAVRNYARNVLLFRDSEASRLSDKIERTVELLSRVTDKRPEPLVNIVAFYDRNRWTVYLFPRDKHRPGVFHTGELTVSPGTIDLCGIFVVPFQKDFDRISGQDIAAIFREVTLADDIFETVVAKLESH